MSTPTEQLEARLDEKVATVNTSDELSPRKKYAILSILILSYFIDGECNWAETC